MTEALALIRRIEGDLAALRHLLDVPEELEPEPEEWLPPCEIAYQLGIGEAYCRKLIRRGLAQGIHGFNKRGGRLFATVEAVKALWNG